MNGLKDKPRKKDPITKLSIFVILKLKPDPCSSSVIGNKKLDVHDGSLAGIASDSCLP